MVDAKDLRLLEVLPQKLVQHSPRPGRGQTAFPPPRARTPRAAGMTQAGLAQVVDDVAERVGRHRQVEQPPSAGAVSGVHVGEAIGQVAVGLSRPSLEREIVPPLREFFPHLAVGFLTRKLRQRREHFIAEFLVAFGPPRHAQHRELFRQQAVGLEVMSAGAIFRAVRSPVAPKSTNTHEGRCCLLESASASKLLSSVSMAEPFLFGAIVSLYSMGGRGVHQGIYHE